MNDNYKNIKYWSQSQNHSCNVYYASDIAGKLTLGLLGNRVIHAINTLGWAIMVGSCAKVNNKC